MYHCIAFSLDNCICESWIGAFEYEVMPASIVYFSIIKFFSINIWDTPVSVMRFSEQNIPVDFEFQTFPSPWRFSEVMKSLPKGNGQTYTSEGNKKDVF